MLPRIQHVSIPRPPGSDAQTRTFYGELLGFEEIPTPHTLEGVIWYQLGAVELHLFEQPNADGLLGRHVCIEVEDVAVVRQLLEQAGYTTEDNVPIPGRPRFFARDPFGNRLEFTSVNGDYRTLAS